MIDYNVPLAYLNKLSTALQWGTNGHLQVVYGQIRSRSCVLHAPGPSKYVLPALSWWFNASNDLEASTSARPAPSSAIEKGFPMSR